MTEPTPDPSVHDDFVAKLIANDRASAERYLQERGLSIEEWERHHSAGPAVEHPAGTFAAAPAVSEEEPPVERTPPTGPAPVGIQDQDS